VETDSASIADSSIFDQLDDPEAPTVHFMPFMTVAGEACIAGTVTDSLSNAIEGVIVQVAGQSVSDSTDSNGWYVLDGLENGYYDITFSHDAYWDTSMTNLFPVINDTLVIDMTLAAWQGCDYVVGDANGSGNYNGLDVTYGVAYFKGGNPPPYLCDCPPHGTWYVAGDVNGSCDYNGLDITYGVNYLKGVISVLIPCPDCPPVGE